MNDILVHPIRSVTAQSFVPETTEITTREPVSSGLEESPKQLESESEQTRGLSNISIHFQVDDESKELTVFVIDRDSRRVIRSIPASEFSKLQAGDLLKLTA